MNEVFLSNRYSNIYPMALSPDVLFDKNVSNNGYTRWVKCSGVNARKVWDVSASQLSSTAAWSNTAVNMIDRKTGTDAGLLDAFEIVIPSGVEEGYWMVSAYEKTGSTAARTDECLWTLIFLIGSNQKILGIWSIP